MGAENLIEIVINLVARGDGAKVTAEQWKSVRSEIEAIQELAGKGDPGAKFILATAQMQKVVTLLHEQKAAQSEVNTQTDAHKAKLAAVVTAQQAETAETDKATTSKKSLADGLKGLSTAFPQLTQLVRAGTSAWGLLAAAVGGAIAMLREYSVEVSAAGRAAESYAEMTTTAGKLAVVHRELATSVEAVARAYAAVGTSLNAAGDNLTKYNAALLLKQQLEEKLADAQLDKETAQIDASDVSDSKKIELKSSATERARTRKEDKRIGLLQAQADAQRTTSFEQFDTAAREDDAARGMQPEIEAATLKAKAAAKDQAKLEKVNAPQIEKNNKILELVRTLEENGGNLPLTQGIGKGMTQLLDPSASLDALKKFGPTYDKHLPEVRQQLIDENEQLESGPELAKANAEAAATRLKALEAKQKVHADAATANKTDAKKNFDSSEATYTELGPIRASRSKIDAEHAEAVRIRTEEAKRQADEKAAKAEQEQKDREAREAIQRAKHPDRVQDLNGSSRGGADNSGVASVAPAMQENTSAVEELGEVVIDGFTRQNEVIARIIRNVSDVTSRLNDSRA